MRETMDSQMSLGEVDVSQIFIDPTSRDEISQLLLGLQHVYRDRPLRAKIFGILEKMDAARASPSNGRPGMSLWNVLVFALLRLNCDLDYASLSFHASHNTLIQKFLGHSDLGYLNTVRYPEQTIRDNVSILTVSALNEISTLVVKDGQAFLNVKDSPIHGKSDSYVMETNVHFPTDLSVLFDAVRKTITLAARVADALGLTGWRQKIHNVTKARDLFKKARKACHRKKKKDDGAELKEVVNEYINHSQSMLDKARLTLRGTLFDGNVSKMADEALMHAANADVLIGQMRRRLINGEVIPHGEKIFSVFETHTEWISKGKAGKPQELGVRLCILQDQNQFILNYKVMFGLTDEKVGVEMVEETKKNFDNFASCSFDKGFHSPEAQEKLKKLIPGVYLPKKGKRNQEETEREGTPEFAAARRRHPAIESAINALENHGLDRCPDHGKEAFERYIAIGILARNMQILGKHIAVRMTIKIKKDKAAHKKKMRIAA